MNAERCAQVEEEYLYLCSLRNENHRLRKENAALKAELEGAYVEMDRLRRQCGDHLAALAVGESVRVGKDR